MMASTSFGFARDACFLWLETGVWADAFSPARKIKRIVHLLINHPLSANQTPLLPGQRRLAAVIR
jgi:hypothetical protein